LNSYIQKGILIGFESTNYKVYLPEKRAIIIARDVRINENDTFKDKEEESLDDSDYNEEYLDEFPRYKDSEILNNSEKLAENQENQEASENSKNGENTTNNEEESEQETEETEENDTIQIPRRSTRANKGQRSRRLAEMASNAYISLIKDPEESKLDIKEPKSYREAINSSEKELWLDSMKKELRTLKDNNTWTLTNLPKD
jgi:hypothetical protein